MKNIKLSRNKAVKNLFAFGLTKKISFVIVETQKIG